MDRLSHKTKMVGDHFSEEFKPIPVKHGTGPLGAAAFRLRMIPDLQLLTCVRFLSPRLAAAKGAVLDVGCGEMPFRALLPPACQYTGIDVPVADEFGMTQHPDIVAFDGIHIPFPDASFDCVMCTEVLEHVRDPDALIAEMFRVLRPAGSLLVTVPFSARVHHAPHDYSRFTRYRLTDMFRAFADVTIEERGDDLAVLANKLIVICMRLLKPSPALIWRLPLLLILGPMTAVSLLIAHISLKLGWGSRADPLGYGLCARKAA